MEEENNSGLRSLLSRMALIVSSLSKKNLRILFFAFVSCFLFSVIYLLYIPPRNFPLDDVVTVHSGETLQSITEDLYSKHIIRSKVIFRSLVIFFGGEKKVIAGDYLLSKKEGSVSLAYRLSHGRFYIDTIKITIPEGWTLSSIASYLSKTLYNFNETEFLSLTKGKEGYLFPDTYFVGQTSRPDFIINMMSKNFEQKVISVPEVKSFGKPLKDIITMASILEEEALPKDRQIVAGILWRRISIGMPLQVDSTLTYINGKDSLNLTLDDLKINSPYNTYKYLGLPPTPISNPGLNAIESTVKPIKTTYLYFLTEKDGTIHYATTFEEHKVNKEKYLK